MSDDGLVPSTTIVEQARVHSGLTRAELARLAGVAPSTVTRIESGEMDPTLGMVNQLLLAAGVQWHGDFVPVSDATAIAAARGLIDPDSGLLAHAGTAEWVARWTRAGYIDTHGRVSDYRVLSARAAHSADLSRRAGIVHVERQGSWWQSANTLRASGLRWAATGSEAALRFVRQGRAPWPVFYVEDTDAAITALKAQPTARATRMSLIPFDGICEVGTYEDAEGFVWADPLQVVIDCLAGKPGMPEQAKAILELWSYDDVC